jgi:hypothetical protein
MIDTFPFKLELSLKDTELCKDAFALLIKIKKNAGAYGGDWTYSIDELFEKHGLKINE